MKKNKDIDLKSLGFANVTLAEIGKKFILTLRIMDDMLARWVFKNPRCVEILVNTILKKQIKVIESLTQYNMDNAEGRSAIVDVLATTEDGKRIVIEIQRTSDEWLPLRARHICSVSDANLIKKGTEFKDIHEFYTIFIMEKDPFGKGQSVYTINRMFRETNELFQDRQTIIFVNVSTEEEGEVKDLVEDFLIRDYEKIKNEVFRETVRLIKNPNEEEDEGVMEFVTEEMKILAEKLEERGREEGREEGVQQGIEKGIQQGIEKGREEGFFQSAMNLLKMGFSVEDAEKATGLSREKIMKLKASF